MNWRWLVLIPVAAVVLAAGVYVVRTFRSPPAWQQVLGIVLLTIAAFVASWAGNVVHRRSIRPKDPSCH